MKEWYTCELPTGKVLTFTLDECKDEAEKYMRGDTEAIYNGVFVIIDTLSILRHTNEGHTEEVMTCDFWDNGLRGELPIMIDYGVLGFVSAWKESR